MDGPDLQQDSRGRWPVVLGCREMSPSKPGSQVSSQCCHHSQPGTFRLDVKVSVPQASSARRPSCLQCHLPQENFLPRACLPAPGDGVLLMGLHLTSG